MLNICLTRATHFLENLAFNKSTWRQGGLYGSNHAVDGQKSSLSVWGQDCVPQDLTQTAEWRVDLGEILRERERERERERD